MDAMTKDIQRALNRLGYRLKVDGARGTLTRGAMRAAGVDPGDPEQALRDLERLLREEAPGLYFPPLLQVRRVFPDFPEDYLEPLHTSIRSANIQRPWLAAYLAQLGHETDMFRTLTEYGDVAYFTELYEGRETLGNTEPGDGARFRGRGSIQLTGRYNYQEMSEEIGVDLVSHPADAASPDIAFDIGARFWTSRALNSYAAAGDFVGLTRRINGGTTGLPHRESLLEQLTPLFQEPGGDPRAPSAAPERDLAAASSVPLDLPLTAEPLPPRGLGGPTLIPPLAEPPVPIPDTEVSVEILTPTQTDEDDRQPVKDWLDDVFSRERSIQRRGTIRRTFKRLETFLMGIHEKLLEDIDQDEHAEDEEAHESIIDLFVDVVVEELVKAADERLTWKLAPEEVRAWLEKYDGPFIRRLFRVARARIALQKQRRVGPLLLAMIPVLALPEPEGLAAEEEEDTDEDLAGDEEPEEEQDPAEVPTRIVEASTLQPKPTGPSAGGGLRSRLRNLRNSDHAETGRLGGNPPDPADLPERRES